VSWTTDAIQVIKKRGRWVDTYLSALI